MSENIEVIRDKYKLVGFESDKKLAVVMIVSTGKLIKLKLAELLKSDLIDDLSRPRSKVYTGNIILRVQP